MIESQISVNGPQSDVDALLSNNRVLTITSWNVVPLWKHVILKLVNDREYERALIFKAKQNDINLVSLGRLSPIIHQNVKDEVLSLQDSFLNGQENILKDDLVIQVLEKTSIILNNESVTLVTLFESYFLNPEINFVNAHLLGIP